ncbi:MAG: hypothetical protein M0R80_03185 [Proteobacteria bacterium]|jgi:hypothetical protein|nr:hypothetical protein [Pseudomonadota bacterium]
MNFKEWMINEAKVVEIPNYVLLSVQHLVGGDWAWKMGSSGRSEVPALRYQWRLVCEMTGRNVRMEGDKYYLKFFVQCFKKTEWAGKPPEAPEGYFGGPKYWGPSNSWERHQKELEYERSISFEKVTEFDPKKGHPLVRFMGFLEGWRPGMMPAPEMDYKTSAEIKGFPIAVSSPGDPRHDMERIGEFTDGPDEQGQGWSDTRLNTPYEIAKFVKESIDRFYQPRGDDDDEPEPEPMPSSPQMVKAEALDREKSRRLRKRSMSPLVRQTAVYT